jgi:3-deoxy-manno-octulosonate cytidylyltransferase (CMP-KDO synthetase)
MDIAAVIPARMAASRYPGKPLVDIHGVSMLEHVYRRTEMSERVDKTWVATPDEKIRDEVESFGGAAILTGPHSRAVDRVAEASKTIDAEVIVVVQGDEPLIHPEMIEDVVKPIITDDVLVATMANRIESESVFCDPNFAKIVFDDDHKALYFSREPIPSPHNVAFENINAYKHVALIPFKRDFLFEFTKMRETPLEKTESIDLLRATENGYDVRVVLTDKQIYQVDTPADHEKANKRMLEDALFEEYKP